MTSFPSQCSPDGSPKPWIRHRGEREKKKIQLQNFMKGNQISVELHVNYANWRKRGKAFPGVRAHSWKFKCHSVIVSFLWYKNDVIVGVLLKHKTKPIHNESGKKSFINCCKNCIESQLCVSRMLEVECWKCKKKTTYYCMIFLLCLKLNYHRTVILYILLKYTHIRNHRPVII